MRSLPASAIGVLALLVLLAAPLSASAQPDVSGSTNIAEPNGFPNICNAPCYTASKAFEVYFDGNPSTPAGPNCPVGDNTYIYKITHTGGSGVPTGFIPAITAFEQSVDTSFVSSAGEIPGFGVSPLSTTINTTNDVITWAFGPGAPGPIPNGGMSTKLFVCSPLLPGAVTDTMVSVDGQLSLDAPGTCLGPVFQPAGEPLPCTIGFWKNRYDGKQGTLKFFPDGDFDAVVTQAVALSGGVFADEAALLADLSSQGNRPMDVRARQQLAAFLLNLAAGDLFPNNSKCKLFEGNTIDSNSCGSGISVADALAGIFADLNGGDFESAKDCADDTNNGIGVAGANSGQ